MPQRAWRNDTTQSKEFNPYYVNFNLHQQINCHLTRQNMYKNVYKAKIHSKLARYRDRDYEKSW
ncbi:hypothetical protein KPK_1197 [Klebsiella variicola]|uniref:Uncharacterized protein n=1 Tax=Klebsiella variicola (strain 342) TaxID=507522 RepID=B5XVL2_KLEV3|nr:hypothetical protein KPK_1197 [Klebsiella variicola]